MAITADNVTLQIDGVLYARIVDPYKASYGIRDAIFAGIHVNLFTTACQPLYYCAICWYP
jgi:regulator of protease activity HflC (stomatin/prohibitin superfamily)